LYLKDEHQLGMSITETILEGSFSQSVDGGTLTTKITGETIEKTIFMKNPPPGGIPGYVAKEVPGGGVEYGYTESWQKSQTTGTLKFHQEIDSVPTGNGGEMILEEGTAIDTTVNVNTESYTRTINGHEVENWTHDNTTTHTSQTGGDVVEIRNPDGTVDRSPAPGFDNVGHLDLLEGSFEPARDAAGNAVWTQHFYGPDGVEIGLAIPEFNDDGVLIDINFVDASGTGNVIGDIHAVTVNPDANTVTDNDGAPLELSDKDNMLGGCYNC
jgi:hypothetical protein